MRELLEKLTPALVTEFKPNIDDQCRGVFTEGLYRYFDAPEAQAKLTGYITHYANLAEIEAKEEALVKLFIRQLLARLDKQNKINAALNEAEVQAVINSELGWIDTWTEQTVTHTKKATPFDSKGYWINRFLLGYSTYAMDDTVTLGGRIAKCGSYSGGMSPTADLSKVTGYQHDFFVANMNVMYGYMGVTVLSFLLVPVRLLYKWYKHGWDAFKAEITNRDNIFEMVVNSIIVTFTACAIFAPVISWPFVTVMFTFGLIAAIYTAYYTNQAAKENTKLFDENTRLLHAEEDKLEKLNQALRLELAKPEPDPAEIDKTTAAANVIRQRLQEILAERQPLLVKEENNATFFGKYGTMIKVGIAATTLVAHVIIATVFAMVLTSAFWPGLIVMVALAAAALAYTAYRQYRVYQLEQDLNKERVLKLDVNDHVRITNTLKKHPPANNSEFVPLLSADEEEQKSRAGIITLQVPVAAAPQPARCGM